MRGSRGGGLFGLLDLRDSSWGESGLMKSLGKPSLLFLGVVSLPVSKLAQEFFCPGSLPDCAYDSTFLISNSDGVPLKGLPG